ncbi:MAG: aminotransferase class IV [Cyanobacteria bacterium P01_F01_bin.42]
MTILTNLNGAIAPTASLPVLERGFLYGDSVYEVVRTYQGQLFGLEEHLVRLRKSADYLYMDVPWSDEHIRQEIERTLAAADWTESYVRIVVSRGAETHISLTPSPDMQPNLLIVLSEISPVPQISPEGLHLTIPKRLRNHQAALSPAAKTGNYLNNILALLEAQKSGADDALLLNSDGYVTEATTSNIWLVKQGKVLTPHERVGILHGITRDFIFEILENLKVPYETVMLTPADLHDIDEGFLSSSVRLLMPINQINETPIPKVPGPLTQRVWNAFIELMAQRTG